MSTKPTPTLPAPYRIATEDEYDRARQTAALIARRYGNAIGGAGLDHIVAATLAAVGVFEPAPEPEPDTCTALYLPHDPEEFGPDIFGIWQQCGHEPGHDPADGHEYDCGWDDDLPGAIPARTADQEA
ncbi:hypothetical protein SAMN05428942_7259 [Streptomyces sp. 2112.2]|uniref:hypothetical protein n=1 Tax=Streptomyces sp. 2112.2 TaxID=1881024 RepID=UPI00089C96B3|nr:hypothetical protein [Streptomyces sp. 2112.2]SEF16384.1 hypothetical protein SAMN05428942_7259 [Streptomyces sp. 2112.2]